MERRRKPRIAAAFSQLLGPSMQSPLESYCTTDIIVLNVLLEVACATPACYLRIAMKISETCTRPVPRMGGKSKMRAGSLHKTMTVNTEIEQNSGLLLSAFELGALVQLYQRVFGKAPDYKSAGVKKFKFLLQSLPWIEFEYKDGNDSSVRARKTKAERSGQRRCVVGAC